MKVCDFGVAANPTIEPSKILRGSCRHYSPESSLDKSNYTEKSDVFMFGVAMWEFMHVKKFWLGKLTAQAVAFTQSGIRPEIKAEAPDSEVIKKCWAQDPKDRPSFRELSDILMNAYNQS